MFNSENISEQTKNLLITQADNLMSVPYPVILASDYSRFHKDGNRVAFEDIYFKRRHMLNTFILAELVDNKGNYTERIIDGLFLLCEESGWQLPPHNSYSDGLGGQPYADVTRPVLDLFSCETGALLAMAYFLLKERLEQISPIILTRINYEVMERILIPYHNSFVWWMGNGTDKTCNWTPWCTQNVLIAAICLDIPEDMLTIILSKAYKSLTYFFNDYGQDGCCDEGALYYRHAGLCLWLSLELLKSQNQDLKFFFDNICKLKNISEYIMNVHVSGPYYINYADCAPNPGPCSIREFLFGKMTGSTELMNFAAEDYCNNSDYILSEEINLLYRYISLIKENEIREYYQKTVCTEKKNTDIKNTDTETNIDTDAKKKNCIKKIWYESTGLAIYKKDDICLAVKGGHNNDSHNHNDTGSITLYMKDLPVLIDLGVESYTAKTFSGDRYSIWTMQSSYHNLPEVNGCMELPGPEYKAKILENTSNSISMDIADAYDKKGGLKNLFRKVSLTDTDAVTLEDTFIFGDNAEHSVTENFMTYYKPQWVDNKLYIGDAAQIVIEDYEDCYIEEIPITDKRLSKSYKEHVYRIRVKARSNNLKLTIKRKEGK
ncbi:MAG: heparinase [Lachnospiraceae bacterium]|nr:heparinase [Lachnospiraceae bacterium]